MDQDDPIQQLLKSTGWSCEDLLKKLQTYKCTNESAQKNQATSQSQTREDPVLKVVENDIEECRKESTTKGTAVNPVIKLVENDIEECIKESTTKGGLNNLPQEENTEKDELCDKSFSGTTVYPVIKVVENDIEECIKESTTKGVLNNLSQEENTEKDESFSGTSVNPVLKVVKNDIEECMKESTTKGGLNNLPQEGNTEKDKSFPGTSLNQSDVNITNNSIPNIGESQQTIISEDYNNVKSLLNEGNSEEVTEVSVVELSVDIHKSEERDENTLKSKEIEQSETYFQDTDHGKIQIETESTSKIESANNDIEYVEVHPRKRFKILNRKMYNLFPKKYFVPTACQIQQQNYSEQTEECIMAGKHSDQLEILNIKEGDIDDILPKTIISFESDKQIKKTVVISSSNGGNTNSTDMEDVLPKTLISSNISTNATTHKNVQKSSKLKLSKTAKELRMLKPKIAIIRKLEAVDNFMLKSRNAPQDPPKVLCSLPMNNAKNPLVTENICNEENTTEDLDLTEPLNKLSRINDSDNEYPEECTSLENEDDIRNNLKLQLNSLRTKKKSQFFETTSSKDIDDNLECSKKLALLASLKNSSESNLNIKEKCSIQQSYEETSDVIYTQSNELGLVILNVQGGVELDDYENGQSQQQSTYINKGDVRENCYQNKELNQHKDNDIFKSAVINDKVEDIGNGDDSEQMRVFDQIRKIINKQRDPLKSTKPIISNNLSPKSITSKSIDDKKMDILSVSGENSQSSCIVETVDVEEKSPFVSNTLDEFLNVDSKLNISYQVPKLGAEDGFKNIIEESPLILKKVKQIKESSDIKFRSTSTVKAKTVAQKRKLLEREMRKELRKQEKKELRELKGKVKEVSKIIEKLKTTKNAENNENKYDHNQRSYVLFNDNKIWVNSTALNKCIAKINCTKKTATSPQTCQRKKFSLLHSTNYKDTNVKYKPGPLRKKLDLQITGNDKWETQILKLPKILLEVSPKLGKSFCNTVLHRFSTIIGGELNTNTIEFALSAVKSKNEDDKQDSFFFSLDYHNKADCVIVRQPKTINIKSATEGSSFKSTQTDDFRDTVASVIENLIKYVEIKELAPTLIKEDNTLKKIEDDVDVKVSPIEKNSRVFKKPNRKRSKIDCELLRLSCKVVNVEVEENVNEVICLKPYCKLGCVCKSLKCDYIFTRHCQKAACMFDCKCPTKKPLVYSNEQFICSGETNLLSRDTVTRIEDEAKKNLAKIERDFTQTVIHTNDKTIVVGIGDRTKTKRTAKAPAKFSDFVSTSLAICEEFKSPQECVVSLPKLNLSKLIPYCWTHNRYRCFCNGLDVTTLFDETNKFQYRKSEINDDYKKQKVDIDRKKFKKNKNHVKIKKEAKPVVKDFTSADDQYNFNLSETENSSVDETWSPHNWSEANVLCTNKLPKRFTRNIKKKTISDELPNNYNEQLNFTSSSCARTKPITKIYQRTLKYNNDVYHDDFINVIGEDKLQKYNVEIPASESDLLKQSLIEEKMSTNSSQPNKNKRKQILESRPDVSIVTKPFNQDAALQRRKKVFPQTRKNVEIRSVFDGEIIINENNMELLKKMGPKTVADGYARLIPWTSLIRSYNNKSINIWSMIDQPSRLLINKTEKKCPKNYVNIDDSSQVTEVITWIKTNKLPSHYQEESLSFILKETKDNYEICGICTKNISEKSDDILDVDKDEDTKFNDANMTDRGEIFYHKDLTGVERFFILNKKHYDVVDLIEAFTGSIQISIALPPIYNICKWRMIFLNSDFTFLFFKSIPYSIRYTDLLVVCDYSKIHKCTVWLRNKQLQKEYEHKLFGIYFDPLFTDRIFIGPYFKDFKSNDVETLRYINQSLVSTESFNMMRGRGDYKCGHWLVETNKKTNLSFNIIEPLSKLTEDKSETELYVEPTIDLTSDNDDEFNEPLTICEMSKDPSDKQEYYPFSSVIIHNKQEVKIIDAPPRKPEDFNRYIITNIPHFGYLGAFTHDQGEIDVCWPFENKLLRFCNESSATSFLQGRFSSLLLGIPETFKVNTIVALKIDLEVNKPIDSAVLNGHYICGEFGYMNVFEASDEDCRTKVGIPKQEIMKLFSKRAQHFVLKKIETLSSLLQIPQNKRGVYDLPLVLKKATEEINLQVKRDCENLMQKNILFLKKRENALKLHKLISELPTHQRNVENLKFRAILHKTDPSPIEIHDSDEDLNKNNTLKEFKPPTSLTCGIKNKPTSVLKPLVTVPIDKKTSILMRADTTILKGKNKSANTSSIIVNKPQYIKGVKLIKKNGGFVMLKDFLNKSKTTTTVKNNVMEGQISEVSTATSSNQTGTDEGLPKVGAKKIESCCSINLDNSKEDSDLDVIPVENEPMIIDLDEFSSDDDLENKQHQENTLEDINS